MDREWHKRVPHGLTVANAWREMVLFAKSVELGRHLEFESLQER